jgi:hypothetical protein
VEKQIKTISALLAILKTQYINKQMGLIKIFSGSEVLAIALQEKIEAVGVATVKKDNIQSARLAGFGNSDLAVELFIQEIDFGKSSPVIEEFRLSI